MAANFTTKTASLRAVTGNFNKIKTKVVSADAIFYKEKSLDELLSSSESINYANSYRRWAHTSLDASTITEEILDQIVCRQICFSKLWAFINQFITDGWRQSSAQ